MLSVVTLSTPPTQILGAYAGQPSPAISDALTIAWVSSMAHPSRVKSKIVSGLPHMPFQEFTADSLDILLGQLKKADIADARIEVSSSEDGHHYACSQPLTNILVYTSRNIGEEQDYKDLIALYQYCSDCKNAVRVL